MTGLFPDNEGPLSKAEEANQQNNDNKSTACGTRQATEAVDYGLPHQEDSNSPTQIAVLGEGTLETNNTDLDSAPLLPEMIHSELINTTSTNSPQECKNKNRTSPDAEISNKTTKNKESEKGGSLDEIVMIRSQTTIPSQPTVAPLESSTSAKNTKNTQKAAHSN